MVYYQVHGRLRSDVKIAYSPFLPTWPFVYDEYGPSTPATHRSSNFIVLQYRQTLMGSTRDNPDRAYYSPHPDFQWVSEREPVYQLSHDGVPIMEIYANTPAQDSESELGQMFNSETGNFTVQVPPYLEFAETTHKVDSGNPGTGILSVHIYQSGSYAIHYFDLPAEPVADPNASQALLDGIRDLWLRDFKGTLIEERAISLGDHPGREAFVEMKGNNQPNKIKIHYYLVQNRIYLIWASIPKDGTFTAEMEAFLQSFDVLVKAPADWQAFKSEEGNFAVQVPPDLEFTEETLEVDSTSLHIYNANFSEGNGSYGIFYYNRPAEVVVDPDVSQVMLDGHRDGWLAFFKGTPIEERAVFLGNHPGREIIVETKYNDLPVKIKARYYLVNNRFYQIEARIPKDGTFPAEMDAFLQSFALLEDS
jgi:hypothetical protein